MADYPVTAFDQLDDEWERLLASGELDRALECWTRLDERLGQFSSVGELLKLLADSSAEPERQSAVLLSLLYLARTDRQAGRLVLQRFMPALKRMAGWDHPLPQADWVAQVVSTAFEVIVSYPLERRPQRVAANIVCDVRKRLYAVLTNYRWGQAELTCRRPAYVEVVADPAEMVEAAQLLRWAAKRSRLARDTAQLIGLTRVAGYSLEELSATSGVPSSRLRQRRWRGERRLRHLLSSA